MKLSYFQLETHLTKQLASSYIVSGEELFLKQEAVRLIREAATRANFIDRVRVSIETGFNWDELYTLLYSTSLLAEKRLIELDFRNMQSNKIPDHILKEYGEKPTSKNILLIDITKIDDKIAKSAWYQALEKIGIVVTIWPIAREQLPQWIIQRAKKYKLSINENAANFLANYVEGNLSAAAQFIEKILLLQPQQNINLDFIKLIIADESRFSIFDFIQYLIAGDIPRTLQILNNLKLEGTEPLLILWGITRELRLLAELKEQLQQGLQYEKLWQKYRIYFQRQHAMRYFLTKFTVTDCRQLLSATAEIDQIIKGAIPGNSWHALELFCLRMV